MVNALSTLLLVQLLMVCRSAIASDFPDALVEARNDAALNLVISGNSSWTIVVPDDCTPREREAASQLSSIVAAMTGVTLPVRSETEAPGTDRILIGDTRAGLALAKSLGVDRETLGEDGFAIKASGRNLLLVSGLPDGGPTEPLGIVYAINHLLEVDLTDAGPLTGLRLTIDALETCPSWHLGAGSPSWFFLDELRLE